jgi:hypothetical protein
VETPELDAVEIVVPVVTLEDVLGEELPGVEPELEVGLVALACELEEIEFVVPVFMPEDVPGEEMPDIKPELEVVTAACEFEEEPSVDTEEVVVVSPPGLIASIAIDRFCANHSRIDNFSSSLLSSLINIYVKDAFRK